MNRAGLRYLLTLAALAAAYFLLARLGLLLDPVGGFATLVWPPTGLSLAALLILGGRMWPAVAVGAFLANVALGAPVLVAAGIAAGNTLEAVLAALVLGRVVGFQRSLERVRDALGLIVVAAVLSTALAATVGTLSLLQGGVIGRAQVVATWQAWWLGDAIADLVLAPLLLTWAMRPRARLAPGRFGEALLLGASLVVVGLVVFGIRLLHPALKAASEVYLLLPALTWAALRFGPRGASAATFLASALATLGTALGRGPFVRESLAESLLFLQVFMAEVAAAVLVLAAIIAEREHARELTARLAAIVEHSEDAVVGARLEPGGQAVIETWNAAAARLYGFSPGEAIGRPLSMLLPPDVPDELPELVARLRRGEAVEHHEAVRVRKDGRRLDVALTVSPIKDADRLVGISKTARDITEQKRTQRNEKFLAEATELLLGSLDYEATLATVARLAAPALADACAVHVTADDGSIRLLAAASADASKLDRAWSSERLHPVEADASHGVAAVLRTGRPELHRNLDSIPDGEAEGPTALRPLRGLGLKSYLGVPMLARGRILGVISLGTMAGRRCLDAGDLALAEALAWRAALAVDNARLYAEAQEAIHAREDFVAIAAHDLRSPLAALSLQVQRMKRLASRGSPEDPSVTAAALERSVARLLHLIDNLLDASRISAGKLTLRLEDVDLSALLGEVVERAGDALAKAGCTATLRVGGSVLGRWDPLRLEQVVDNLLSNAIKYAPGKPLEVSLDADEATARLVVRDHGPGIPEGQQKGLFERFERASPGSRARGFGLGLWIVRQVVEALGGTIEVQSHPGEGATFTVTLPRAPRPAPP